MAVGVDMFGAGGEGLGGLFVGNELAMQRDIREQEMANKQAEMARSQALTRGTELSNQYEEAILGDKIAAYKSDAAKKKEGEDLEKFNRQGEQFGRLGQVMRSVPAAARGAALRQMATQGGIAEDNPMLQHMMNADPESLPDMLDAFSKGFYEQSDKARIERLKGEERTAQAKVAAEAKAAEGEANRALRRDIAEQGFALRRDLAAQSQAGQDRRAGQRAAAKTGADGKPVKMTTDQAIAASIMNNPNLSDEEKLEALQRHTYTKATVAKSGTEEEIFGTEKPVERARSAAAPTGKAPAGAQAGTDIATAVKKAGEQYEPNKYEYRITADGRVQKRPK